MSTVAIIQARMRSSRLPGKMLMPLAGRPLLACVLDRVRLAASIDSAVVATTAQPEDDPLVDYSRTAGVACFRGSESDVLGRFHAAAKTFDARLIVRVSADNPLIDPHYLDALVASALQENADYTTYRRADGKPAMLTPVSFFAEALTRSCLDRADREISDPFQREHVTLGIYTRPDRFRLNWLPMPDCCNDPRLRFTVDTQEDLDLLQEIYSFLGQHAADAGAADVIRIAMEHPEWLERMDARNRANIKASASSN